MARFLYNQRPSKHVQRRMVIDACRKLRWFAPLPDYEFVGFGAYEFVDFELCRRELGVLRMHSIEANTNAQDRYKFNRPFASIDLHFDRATNVLPDLLDDPVLRIVWLDYTQGLDREVLQDIGTCARRLQPGSALIVTTAARPDRPMKARRAGLVAAVGPERVDVDMTDQAIGRRLPEFQARILRAETRKQLKRRSDGCVFKQLFNIRYRDDQPMHTWGGLILHPSTQAAYASAHFGELTQVSDGDVVVDATVEPLTMRETLHLNRQLPLPAGAKLQGDGIPAAALDAYRRLYPWYPSVPVPM